MKYIIDYYKFKYNTFKLITNLRLFVNLNLFRRSYAYFDARAYVRKIMESPNLACTKHS